MSNTLREHAVETIIGVEFAQRRSHSAICVATNLERFVNGRFENHFLIRTLERLEIGTTFPEIAERLAKIEAGAIKQAPNVHLTIYVNSTGVGDALVELLNSRTQTRVRPVFMTRGDRRTERWPIVDLGKAYLVARLQMLFQTGRAHLAKTPQAEILAKELLDYEIRVESDANERYGTFPVGSQDDLVMSLGIAVQTDAVGPGGGAQFQVPGW